MTEMPRIEDKLHTVEEVADYFGVEPQTVRLWLNEKDVRKKMEGIKIGRSWRVSRGAMIAYGNRKYAE